MPISLHWYRMIDLLRSNYRKLLPISIRVLARNNAKKIIYFGRFVKLIIVARLNIKLNLVLGAALTSQEGWISTNEQYFDITNPRDWEKSLGKNPNLKKLLAEHVLEHLTYDQMKTFLKLSYQYLNEGGTLLIAVPDGNHPDPEYRTHTGINGLGPDASDHKQFITWETIKKINLNIGFDSQLLEGYDKEGVLINNYHPSAMNGLIMRSRSHVLNNFIPKNQEMDFCDSWTSLIILARK